MDKVKAFNDGISMLTGTLHELNDIMADNAHYPPDMAYGVHVTMLLLACKINNYLKTEASEEFKDRFLI